MSIAEKKKKTCLLLDMCYQCYELELRLDLFSNKKESAGTGIWVKHTTGSIIVPGIGVSGLFAFSSCAAGLASEFDGLHILCIVLGIAGILPLSV